MQHDEITDLRQMAHLFETNLKEIQYVDMCSRKWKRETVSAILRQIADRLEAKLEMARWMTCEKP